MLSMEISPIVTPLAVIVNALRWLSHCQDDFIY